MEILSAIVSGVVTKVGEYAVAPVGRQVGYVIRYKNNLQNLRTEVDNLKEWRQRTIDVNWMTEQVDELTGEVDTFLEDEGHAKTNCFHGICPNPILYYQLSKKATKLMHKIKLHEKTEFPPQEICNVPSQDYLAFGSRISVVKEIMDELSNANTKKIGVYGVGGVGKTTLAKEVYRQANEKKLFDGVVIVVDVKNYPERIQKENCIDRIQKEIAEKLNIDIRECLTEKGRARHLWDKLKEKKILVILDDVWEKIELGDVGIPPTCNILFTSRNREVLFSQMGTQKDFLLSVLGEEESWRLFEKMSGAVVKDKRIQEIATHVLNRCGGLPILIVAVAIALRNGTLHQWKDALRRLKNLDMKESEEKALLTLEWSYNQLEAEELKPLFLLCGIIAWGDNIINLDDCFKYSMGMGLLKNVDTMEEAQAAFLSRIKELQNYCLMQEKQDGNNYTTVRMHELARSVAIMIARRDKHVLLRRYEEEFKEWPNKDFFKKCTMILFHWPPSSDIATLPEVPWQCPELKMLMFDSMDKSLQIPSNFFEEMKELKVLDLTRFRIPSLPPSLVFLTNLQMLCLDQCELEDITLVGKLRKLEILSLLKSKIKQLPKEIGQLARLRMLDLTGCSELVLISPNVIASLKNLEDLRIGRNSFRQWEAEGVRNASLLELKQLSMLTALDIHIPDANILPSDCFSKLERFHIFIGEAWKWLDFDDGINTLKLKLDRSSQLDRGLEMLLKRCEHLYLDVKEGVNISHLLNRSDGFQQLKHLQVQNNAEITHVYNYIAFQNLQSLTLWNLPKLTSFSSEGGTAVVTTRTDNEMSREVMFPNLSSLVVHRCNYLRFMLSSSTARSLINLKHLEITECQMMEEIVSTEQYGDEIIDNMFPHLQHLKLKGLPNLAKFCSASYIDFPSLKRLQLNKCAKLETFISHPLTKNIATADHEIEEEDSKENPETVVKYVLFDKKVGFPRLERLSINGLTKLITIWDNQLNSYSFRSLKDVKVRQCNGLISMLVCQVPEEVISELKYSEENPNRILSELEQLELNDLPNLASFSSKSFIVFSSLKSLKVVECAKLNIFMFDPRNKRIGIYKETEGGDLKENLQTGVQQYIFEVERVVLPNLTSFITNRLDGLSFLLSSFMARSIVQFRHREISACQIVEEIVSARGYGEENLDDMVSKPELLELNIPSLAKFDGYIEFPPNQRWNIVNCIKLDTVFDPTSKNIAIFEEIKETHLEVVHSILFDAKVALHNITRMVIYRCHGLSFLLSLDMAKSLVQLKHVVISECQIMEEIVSLEACSGANIDDMLPKLEQLVLNDLPDLTRFCSGTHVQFPSLARLQLEKCTKLETFISYHLRKSIAIDKEIEERDTEENLETVVPYFLFDNKVEFPELERLTINDLPKLTKIWCSQLAENSFCKLRDVIVQQCNSLINIVPDSIARDFQQLQKLTVENCGVEEIVAQEEGETLTLDQFVLFPKVTCLEFKSLPQLKRFYPRMHAFNWPLLKTLKLFDCRIVDIFASGFSGLPKTPCVLIEKSSFPYLEDLTLGPMDIWYGPPAPAAFYKQAVFPGISSRDTDKTIPHLKTLRLHGMEKLMRLWEESTKPAGPVFLQLETLEVKFCGLNNIELSAISFKNLTNLEVTFCWRLQYLTTYSVAQSLGNLEKLKVDECKSMKEILANDGVGEDANNHKIVFSQLQHLELIDLISLERFCSRNCIVEVPLLEASALEVNLCSLKMKISSDKTLEEVDSNMHLNVQKSHSRREEAGATTEAASSLETNQKQPSLIAESEHGVEAVIQETAINSQNQKKVVTIGMQADSGSQLHSQHTSKLEAEIRHLQAEMRAKEAELRDKEQKLAEERLATVDPKGS